MPADPLSQFSRLNVAMPRHRSNKPNSVTNAPPSSNPTSRKQRPTRPTITTTSTISTSNHISPPHQQNTPLSRPTRTSSRHPSIPATFSQEWIDKKQRILKKRAKREYTRKLARIVIDHWKQKAWDRITALRARIFAHRMLLLKTFRAWRAHVFGDEEMFRRGNSGIALFESRDEGLGMPRLSISTPAHGARLSGGLLTPSFGNATRMPPPSMLPATPTLHQPPTSAPKLVQHNTLWEQQFIVATRREFLLKQAFFRKWKRKAQHMELERRNERRKISLASNHYLMHLKQMAFRQWQRYIQLVHQKQKNNEKAYVFLYTSTLKKAFHGWQVYIRLKKEAKEKMIIADDFYCTHLLRDVFRHFRVLRQELAVHREKMARADQFHLFCLKKQTMEAFKHLLWLKQRRLRDAALVDEFREMSIPRFHFRTWRCALRRRIEARKRHKYAVATDFFETHLLQHVLRAWRKYKDEHLEKRLLKEQADQFWMRHHGAQIFHLLQQCAEERRAQREMKNAADEFYESSLKHRFMQRFSHAYLHRQRTKSLKQLATQHYEQHVKRKMFMRWINKINDIIEVENELENAREYYEVRLMFNAVQAWKKYVDIRCMHREDKRIADEHFARMLQRRYMNRWLLRLEERNEDYAKWDRAVHNHNRQLEAQCWNAWMQYIHYRRAKKQLLNDTVQNLRLRLDASKRVRLFAAWRGWYERRVEKRLNEARATNHMRQHLMARVWVAWQRFVFTKQLHKANKRVAQKHYEKNLLRSAFNTLREIYQEAHEEHRRELEASDYFYHNLTRKCFDAWKSYISDKRAYQRQKNEALAMRQQFLKGFALRRMAAATRPHREERLPFLRNPDIPRETLDTYELMVKCFRRWRLKLLQKQKFPTWKVPRRGKPKLSLLEDTAMDFSEQIRKIDPSPAVDELLMNPLERPRPRLPVTFLMDTVREPSMTGARELLSSTRASTRGAVRSNSGADESILKRYGIPTLSTKENVPPTPPSPLGAREREEDIFFPQNDISLGDLQDHTIQYPSFVSERQALADTSTLYNNNASMMDPQSNMQREPAYEKLQQQISQIQDALNRILPLKQQYNDDQKKLQQLRQEMEEFPFEKEESKEYANMERKEKEIMQRMERFQQLRETKLPQLQQVLQKKIRQLRDMASSSGA